MRNNNLFKYSLTGFHILAVIELERQGKTLKLIGNNKFKVVDKG